LLLAEKVARDGREADRREVDGERSWKCQRAIEGRQTPTATVGDDACGQMNAGRLMALSFGLQLTGRGAAADRWRLQSATVVGERRNWIWISSSMSKTTAQELVLYFIGVVSVPPIMLPQQSAVPVFGE